MSCFLWGKGRDTDDLDSEGKSSSSLCCWEKWRISFGAEDKRSFQSGNKKTIFLIVTPLHFDIIIHVSTGNPFAGWEQTLEGKIYMPIPFSVWVSCAIIIIKKGDDDENIQKYYMFLLHRILFACFFSKQQRWNTDGHAECTLSGAAYAERGLRNKLASGFLIHECASF